MSKKSKTTPGGEPPKKPQHSPEPVAVRQDWPVYDSLDQAAGASQVPKKIFQQAKKEGCSAFRSNRVYVGEFIQWWFARQFKGGPEEKMLVARAKRAEFAARREKVEAETAEKLVIPIADAKHTLTRYAVGLRAKLLELPKSLALPLSLTKDVIELEEKLMAAVRGVLGQMFRCEWGKIQCPHCKKEI